MPIRQFVITFAALVLAANASRLFANATTQPASAPLAPDQILFLDADDAKPSATPTSNQSSTRYFFGLLDTQSSYGKDFFPDPFLGPEFDAETQYELDYSHGEARGMQDNEVDAGAQWNPVGQLTLSAEFGWASEHQAPDADDPGESAYGFENVDLGIYHPISQFVSKDNLFDFTAVARLDVDIPTRTPVSGSNVQLTPFFGQLIRLGDHVSIETWTGPQFTIAPNQINQFIYGASFGYELFEDQLCLPTIEKLIPLFELDGQTPFSGDTTESLFGVAGIDLNFHPIGDAQPTIELGYQFPLDQGARDQLQWGIVTEFLLEF